MNRITIRAAATLIAGCIATSCSGADDPSVATDASAPSATAAPAATTAATADPTVDVQPVDPAESASSGSTTPPPPGTNSPEPTAAGPADAAIDAIDAPAVFAAALATTASGYHFVSTVTLGDRVAVTAEGDHAATSTQLRIVSQGVAVDYLVVDGTSWVFDDGVWQELDDDAAVQDPLGQLVDPIDVVVNSTDGELIRLLAGYPAVALGLNGDDIGVIVEIVDGRIVTLEYATDIDGALAAVRAELSALPDPAPTITTPDA